MPIGEGFQKIVAIAFLPRRLIAMRTLFEKRPARSPFSPEWYESSSGELRQIETIKRLIWDAPPCASLPRERRSGGGGESAHRVTILRDSANTGGENQQCASTRRGRLQDCCVHPCWLHTLSYSHPRRRRIALRVHVRARWSGPVDGRMLADRDHAYAPEIALNGWTKALNNATIISDVLSIRARPARAV